MSEKVANTKSCSVNLKHHENYVPPLYQIVAFKTHNCLMGCGNDKDSNKPIPAWRVS